MRVIFLVSLDMLLGLGCALRRMARVCLASIFVLSLFATPSFAERFVLIMQKGSPTPHLYNWAGDSVLPARKSEIFLDSFWAYQGGTVDTVVAAVGFDEHCHQLPDPNFRVIAAPLYGSLSYSSASLPNPICMNAPMIWNTVNYTWSADSSDPSACAVKDPFAVMYPDPGILPSGVPIFFPTAEFAPRIMFSTSPGLPNDSAMDITCNGTDTAGGG